MKFKRGEDPRKSLDIGMDSMDLWHHLPARLQNILDGNKYDFDYQVHLTKEDDVILINIDMESMLNDRFQTVIIGYLSILINKNLFLLSTFRSHTNQGDVFEKTSNMHITSINLDYLNKIILETTVELLKEADWDY